MIELGVNVDHVATVRQARRTYEPDPVWAAVEAHLGGADGITVHLREDRRHIQDEDVRRLRELTHIRLNLEMAATEEMVGIAARIKPEMAMLVPEGRHEITTEGGLDIVSQEKKLTSVVKRLADAGIVVSVFIDAEEAQVEAARRIGAAVCEVHTGPYAHTFHSKGRDAESAAVVSELRKIEKAGGADPLPRHALQRRPCPQLHQRRADRTSAGGSRASHRPRHRVARRVRRDARGSARDEDRDAECGKMIYGVGTDVVEIGRIEKALERFGERFALRDSLRARIEAVQEPPVARGVSRQALRRQGSLHQGAGHRHPRAGELAWGVGAQPALGEARARVLRAAEGSSSRSAAWRLRTFR